MAKKRRTPEFEITEYGRYLKRLGREGVYSPMAKGRILGRVGAGAGAVAQREKAGIRGYLTARGMGGSIAGARALGEPGRTAIRTVGEKAGELDIENELSKARAREEFARMRTMTEERRRGEKRADIGELFGGIAGAGTQLFRDYLGKREIGIREKYYDARLLEATKMSGYNYKELKQIIDDNRARQIINR